MSNNVTFSVFTKPWKTQSIDELAKFISSLGFDGIEFPLREGYQVEPANAEKGLPELVKKLDTYGLKLTSIASDTTEQVFAGCQAAGIPIIRIMARLDQPEGYMACEAKFKKKIEGFLPLCEKYGVKVGIQMHYGPMVSNAMELRHLLEGFDPKYVGGIWDTAHSALAGEQPEQGLDIIWDYLYMVNFKNAYYKRSNGPEAEDVQWKRYFTTGRQGMASWPRVSDYLKNRGYEGVICLTAEFTAEEEVNRLIAEDISFAKSLFK